MVAMPNILSTPVLLHVAHEHSHSGTSAFLGSPSPYWEKDRSCGKRQTDRAGV